MRTLGLRGGRQLGPEAGRREAILQTLLKPKELKARLDDYVIGQELAKETLAVAVYNHYKRFTMVSLPKTHPGPAGEGR